MTPNALKNLDGQTVLVKTTTDTHNPPVGVRGSIRIVDTPAAGVARVELVLQFPDMYNEPAHQRVFALTDKQVEELVACSCNGAYEFTLDTPLDWPSANPARVSPGSVVPDDSGRVPHP